ncbi:MAG: response regulator [Syntrophobacteraceae bacterium]
MKELKVLLVDDEEEFTSALAERFGLRGIRASTASSGEEALKMIEADPPHVVVLDMMMPGIGGIEILARIRSAYPKIGVIFLTGQLHTAADPTLGPAYCEYLVKPVNIEELIVKIRSAAACAGT